MAQKTKKTDQTKGWNRRTSNSVAYKLGSRAMFSKRFLIVCEGKNTEPCYFESFPVQTAEVKSHGAGRSKTSLVQYAIELVRNKYRDPGWEVWIVFDMDFNHLKDHSLQRNDFNEAIRLAQSTGFQVAYSNDSFELWFLLHYQRLESALTRAEYYQRISELWGFSYERHGKGIQFCRSVYQQLLEDPKASQALAINHAKALHEQQGDQLPADHNPCTTVYQLVIELNKHLKK